jgi:pimeloyl-ACP methyl ester carboxylesterase
MADTPLLLLHAGIADRRMWEPILPRLERARRVLAPDLSGYGERPLPEGEFSHVDDDVLAVLDREQVERVAAVGASFGGRVAIDLALSYPERVAALVLASPGLSGWDWSEETRAFGAREDELLESGDFDGAVELNLRTWVDGRGRGPDDVDADTRARVGEMQRRAFDLLLQAYASEPHPEERELDPPAAERLAELSAPTLVIVGDLDLPDFAAIAHAIADRAPRARVLELAGVAHLPALERPELFAELVLAFLAEVGV